MNAPRRNPTRVRTSPERFADLTFVKGSGIVGCDQYDRSYDRGHFYGSLKDRAQASADIVYARELEKALNVEVVTKKLPSDLAREIASLVAPKPVYNHDINFIAPDHTEPEKDSISESEEDEWESGDETEEDEELDLED